MEQKDLAYMVVQFGFAGVLMFVLWKIEPVMRSIKDSLDSQTTALLLVLQKLGVNGDTINDMLNRKNK